jgi:WD40 repeat protein
MRSFKKELFLIIVPLLVLSLSFVNTPELKSYKTNFSDPSEVETAHLQNYEISRAIKINATDKLIWNLTGHNSQVWEVCFDSSGNLLASASSDNTVRIWDVITGQEINNFTDNTHSVYSVAFHPGGNIIAAGLSDGNILLWNITNRQLIGNLTGHTSAIWCVSFSPNGELLASGSNDNTIKLWATETQQNVQNLTEHGGRVQSLAFSFDDQLLVSGSYDNSIKVWNASTGILIHSLENHTDYVESVAFSPDNQMIASASRDLSLKLWDTNTGDVLIDLLGHEGWIRSVAFSFDGYSLASASSDLDVKFWDISQAKLLGNLTEHTASVLDVTFNPIYQMVASCSTDNSIKLWNITDIDSDNLPDLWEQLYELDPGESADRNEDPDGDNLVNIFEFDFGTNPRKGDSDDDLIPDGYEYYNQLNGTLDDSNDDLDGDGMPNLYEYQNNLEIGVNDSATDSDGDGMPNIYEYQNGLLAGLDDDSGDDLDGDGIPNLYEYQNGLLVGVDDAAGDLDDDSLSNLDEYLLGTDPRDPDTDNDGWPDGVEKIWGTNPVLFISNPLILLLTIISVLILIIVLSLVLRRNMPLIKATMSSLSIMIKGRSWINDLQMGKAIPIDLLAKELDQKPLAVPEIVKNELIRQNKSGQMITMQSRILLLESIPPQGANCQICMTDLEDDHFYQCKQCKRYVCIHDYVDLENVGRSDCPNCSGELIVFPFTCTACKLDFASVKELSSQTRCPLCGYDLPNQVILKKEVTGKLIPSELSQKIKIEKETEETGLTNNEKRKNH